MHAQRPASTSRKTYFETGLGLIKRLSLILILAFNY